MKLNKAINIIILLYIFSLINNTFAVMHKIKNAVYLMSEILDNTNNIASPLSKDRSANLLALTLSEDQQQKVYYKLSNTRITIYENLRQDNKKNNLCNIEIILTDYKYGTVNQDKRYILYANGVLLKENILNSCLDTKIKIQKENFIKAFIIKIKNEYLFNIKDNHLNFIIITTHKNLFLITLSILKLTLDWDCDFSIKKNINFITNTGDKITTSFLLFSVDTLSYTCTKSKWTIKRICLQNNYVMDIILPNNSITLEKTKQYQIIVELMSAINNKTKSSTIYTNILMPIFSINKVNDLSNYFADNIFPKGKLLNHEGFLTGKTVNITNVTQKCTMFFSFKEKNITIGIKELTTDVEQFIVNRPFFFIIREIIDKNNNLLVDNEIIIIGKVVNPAI